MWQFSINARHDAKPRGPKESNNGGKNKAIMGVSAVLLILTLLVLAGVPSAFAGIPSAFAGAPPPANSDPPLPPAPAQSAANPEDLGVSKHSAPAWSLVETSRNLVETSSQKPEGAPDQEPPPQPFGQFEQSLRHPLGELFRPSSFEGSLKLSWVSATVLGNTQAFRTDHGLLPGISFSHELSLYGEGELPADGSFSLSYDDSLEPGERFELEASGAGIHLRVGRLPVDLAGWTYLGKQRTLSGFALEAAGGDLRYKALGGVTSDTPEQDRFRGQDVTGPYYLSKSPVVEGSETVRIDGEPLPAGAGYWIDRITGELNFARPVPTWSLIEVDYDYEGPGGWVVSGLSVETGERVETAETAATRMTGRPQPGLEFGVAYMAERKLGGIDALESVSRPPLDGSLTQAGSEDSPEDPEGPGQSVLGVRAGWSAGPHMIVRAEFALSRKLDGWLEGPATQEAPGSGESPSGLGQAPEAGALLLEARYGQTGPPGWYTRLGFRSVAPGFRGIGSPLQESGSEELRGEVGYLAGAEASDDGSLVLSAWRRRELTGAGVDLTPLPPAVGAELKASVKIGEGTAALAAGQDDDGNTGSRSAYVQLRWKDTQAEASLKQEWGERRAPLGTGAPFGWSTLRGDVNYRLSPGVSFRLQAETRRKDGTLSLTGAQEIDSGGAGESAQLPGPGETDDRHSGASLSHLTGSNPSDFDPAAGSEMSRLISASLAYQPSDRLTGRLDTWQAERVAAGESEGSGTREQRGLHRLTADWRPSGPMGAVFGLLGEVRTASTEHVPGVPSDGVGPENGGSQENPLPAPGSQDQRLLRLTADSPAWTRELSLFGQRFSIRDMRLGADLSLSSKLAQTGPSSPEEPAAESHEDTADFTVSFSAAPLPGVGWRSSAMVRRASSSGSQEGAVQGPPSGSSDTWRISNSVTWSPSSRPGLTITLGHTLGFIRKEEEDEPIWLTPASLGEATRASSSQSSVPQKGYSWNAGFTYTAPQLLIETRVDLSDQVAALTGQRTLTDQLQFEGQYIAPRYRARMDLRSVNSNQVGSGTWGKFSAGIGVTWQASDRVEATAEARWVHGSPGPGSPDYSGTIGSLLFTYRF